MQHLMGWYLYWHTRDIEVDPSFSHAVTIGIDGSYFTAFNIPEWWYNNLPLNDLNTLGPEWNSCHFADIFRSIFHKQNPFHFDANFTKVSFQVPNDSLPTLFHSSSGKAMNRPLWMNTCIPGSQWDKIITTGWYSISINEFLAVQILYNGNLPHLSSTSYSCTLNLNCNFPYIFSMIACVCAIYFPSLHHDIIQLPYVSR